MKNLFINIQKYIPRENTNPKENFFSEILAFILNEDKDLLLKFVKLVGLNICEIKNYEIKTQVNHKPYGIVDIEIIINNNIFIIIENKIDSIVSIYKKEVKGNVITENQLEKYLKILQEKNIRGYVILLSKSYEELNEKIKKRIFHILWEDIYHLFKQHTSKNGTVNFLIKQFIGLMEDENMDPYKKITKEMIDGYNDFLDDIYKLFNKIVNILNKYNKQIIKKQFRISWNYIDYYFSFKTIKFSIDFDGEDFNLYIEKKNLTKEQKNDIKNLGFESNRWWFWKTFKINQEFFNYDTKEQIKQIKQFFLDTFNSVKNIIQ